MNTGLDRQSLCSLQDPDDAGYQEDFSDATFWKVPPQLVDV
jgi:hypothetical protein